MYIFLFCRAIPILKHRYCRGYLAPMKGFAFLPSSTTFYCQYKINNISNNCGSIRGIAPLATQFTPEFFTPGISFFFNLHNSKSMKKEHITMLKFLSAGFGLLLTSTYLIPYLAFKVNI